MPHQSPSRTGASDRSLSLTLTERQVEYLLQNLILNIEDLLEEAYDLEDFVSKMFEDRREMIEPPIHEVK